MHSIIITYNSLTSVVIPEGVTSIGWDVFYDCDNLTLTVARGSYAENYAKERGFPCAYISEWTCLICQQINKNNYCTACGEKKPEAWACLCGSSNDTLFCGQCGAKRPETIGWDCACGAHNYTNYCTTCGEKDPALVACSKCSFTTRETAPKYCPDCGKKF